MKKVKKSLFFLFIFGFVLQSSSTFAQEMSVGKIFSGLASVYSKDFVGKKTASGEAYEESKLSAAHKTLPFGTILKITNLFNGKSVSVVVNDRGPAAEGRILDLSSKAASDLEFSKESMVMVQAEVVSLPEEEKAAEEPAPAAEEKAVVEEEEAPVPAPVVQEEAPAVSEDGAFPTGTEQAITKVDGKNVNRLYVLQFGAFSSEQSAKSLAEKLEEKGVKTYITAIGSDGNTLYKVRQKHLFRSEQAVVKKAISFINDGIDCFIIGKIFVS